MPVSNIIVFLLPCEDGYVHHVLKESLEHNSIRYVSFTGTDQLAERVYGELRTYKDHMIILHGWGYGGTIALEVMFWYRPRNVIGLALFAPRNGVDQYPDDIYNCHLYHNVHDTVVDFSNSVSLYKQLKNSTLHPSNTNMDNNNHQGNEFVSACTLWILQLRDSF